MYNYCKRCAKIIKDRHHSAIFCWKCISEKQKEEHKEYNRSKRGELKKYFGENCLLCNSKRQHYHHLDSNTKNNFKQNLIGLCSSCHKKVHYIILKPFISQVINSLKENRFNVNQIVSMTGLSKHIVYKYINKLK